MQQPSWYQALELSARGKPQASSLTNDPRFAAWQSQPPFSRNDYLTQRLALLDLTPTDLNNLLAETDQDLAARINTPLAWVAELETILQTDTSKLAEQKSHFWPLLKPFVAYALQKIQADLPTDSRLPFEPQSIVQMWQESLVSRLESRLMRAFITELHLARPIGDTPEKRYQNYVEWLSQKENLTAFLQKYKVLARQLIIVINQWVTNGLELLNHLTQDWQLLEETFQIKLGELTKLESSLGDAHHSGRTVLKLTFANNFRLIYKPRSLQIDQHFQELLTWLNLGLRTLKIINQADHGWLEFVEVATCSTQTDLKDFYRRIGYYLAIFYLLDGTDLHHENLIAAGSQPVVIDLETLFQARTDNYRLETPKDYDPAYKMWLYSVQRIGLLPHREGIKADFEGSDISGFGQQKNQVTLAAISVLEGIGTDQMRIVKKRLPLAKASNQPTLNDQSVNALDYLNDLIAGFEQAYRLFLERKADLVAQLDRFATDPTRFIARPTLDYTRLLRDSFHPSFLQNGLARSQFFDRLWQHIEFNGHLARLVNAEQADMEQVDVPFFSGMPNSPHLYTSQGQPITDFFHEPPLEIAKRHLATLSEADLIQQSWIIKAALASTAHNNWQRSPQPLEPIEVDKTMLLKMAGEIAMQLNDLAVESEDGRLAGWLTLASTGKQGWRTEAAGLSLYDGLPGIALFLAYYGKITSDEHYTSLAKKTVQNIERKLAINPPTMSLGAFQGWGSLLYLFASLRDLWPNANFEDQIESIINSLPSQIEEDKVLDVVSGAAGCLLALLKVDTPQALTVAKQCGDWLVTCALPTPQGGGIGWLTTVGHKKAFSGFSHGAAGIAYSLLRLAKRTDHKRYQETALAALDYERSLFDQTAQNWPHLHNDQEADFMNAWCYGAPGVALAFLEAGDQAQVKIALNTTIKQGFGINHSLCHGELGNLETLLVATNYSHEYKQALADQTKRVLSHSRQHGWTTAYPLNLAAPSLMTGISGIGYQLLRLAEPTQIPSILLLM